MRESVCSTKRVRDWNWGRGSGVPFRRMGEGDDGERRRERRLRRVVLPEPEGPITARSSPGRRRPVEEVRMGVVEIAWDREDQVREVRVVFFRWEGEGPDSGSIFGEEEEELDGAFML